MSTNIIAPGTHEVRVVDHYLAEIGEKKTPALLVTFENDLGHRITWSGWLSEKAIVRTVDTLEQVLGWDAAADGYELAALSTDNPKLAGHECQIVVEEETYEGTTRNKVKWVNPKGSTGGGPGAMEVAAAKALSASMRARIASSRGPKPTTAPSRPAAPAKAAARDNANDAKFDESIPF